MKNSVILLALVSVLLFFEACVPTYVPNVINTPLFNGQGDIQAGIHTGVSGNDPQLAYAAGEHWGLMFNGSFANRQGDSSDNFHKHSFAELGAGYYTKFLDNGCFEVFGGYGLGSLEAKYRSSIFSSDAAANYGRFFIQPAIGASTNIFDGSFATRFCLLRLSQSDSSLTAAYIEPAITAKIGYKYVKAVFQFGFSLPLSESATHFYAQPIIMSIGLQGFFGGPKQKKKF